MSRAAGLEQWELCQLFAGPAGATAAQLATPSGKMRAHEQKAMAKHSHGETWSLRLPPPMSLGGLPSCIAVSSAP